MSNLAIIGSMAKIIGFKALGITVLEAENVGEVKIALETIAKDKNYKLVFILESLATESEALLAEYSEINVVPIPDQSGKRDYLKQKLKGLVKEAIGTEVTI